MINLINNLKKIFTYSYNINFPKKSIKQVFRSSIYFLLKKLILV